MKNASTIMTNNEEEAVKESEGDGVDCEKAHRGNDFTVVLRKALHRTIFSGFLGDRWTQQETVRSETSKPSICSSP